MPITILPLYFSHFMLLFYGATLIIGIIVILKTIKLYKSKTIKGIDLFVGLIISLTLFGFLNSLFPRETNGLVLSMFVSLIMVFIPFVIYLLAYNSKKDNFISKVLLISIACTFTVIICFLLLTSILIVVAE